MEPGPILLLDASCIARCLQCEQSCFSNRICASQFASLLASRLVCMGPQNEMKNTHVAGAALPPVLRRQRGWVRVGASLQQVLADLGVTSLRRDVQRCLVLPIPAWSKRHTCFQAENTQKEPQRSGRHHARLSCEIEHPVCLLDSCFPSTVNWQMVQNIVGQSGRRK